MTAKKAVVRRAAGAALALVLGLVVVGSVAAATRGDRTPPTTPTNLRVTSLSHKSVTLAWNPSTDKSGSFSYSVNMDGLSFTVPQTQTSYTITSLSAGQTYTFYVTATDKALNQSGRSNTVTATTLADTTPPTAPQLSGTVRGPSQVSLTWTRSTDDLAWFVGYRIFANGAPVTAHVNWYGETEVVLRHLTPADVVHVHRSGARLQRQHGDEQPGHPDDPGDQRRDAALGADQRAHRRQQWCLRVLGRLDPVHRRHRPSVRDRVRDLCQRGSEPTRRRSRNRQGLRLRHGERREHVHRESSGSGGQHLGGEQRGDGRLLRSGARDRMLQGRPTH